MMKRGRVGRLLACAVAFVLMATVAVPAYGGGTPVEPGTPSLSGVVKDAETGMVIPGIEVWLEKSGPIGLACFQSATTDQYGIYTFSDVPAGYRYWLKVNGQKGYATYEGDEFAYTGGLVYNDIELEPIDLAVGGLLTKGGAPVSGYKVKLFRESDKGSWWVDYQYTEQDGAFGFGTDSVEPGTYYLVVFDKNYEQVLVSDRFVYEGVAVTMNIELEEGPGRIAGGDRFDTAVEIARAQFDPAGDASWPDVTDVVIASGDDRASADPLSAAGLCGALDAPLFLVSAAKVPSAVKTAVAEIVKANGPVTVHVVGGEASVPAARLAQLAAYVGEGKLTFVRIAGSSRYSTAEKVANRLAALSGDPEVVLVANGSDPTKFFDALALSPLAAAKGFPILLTSVTSVPKETTRALGALKPDRIIVAGGTSSVSSAVVSRLGAERWAGASRYDTAVVVAEKAALNEWLTFTAVGIAAKLPDALAGGGFCGMRGGVMVLTDGATLSPATGRWLESHAVDIESCTVFGGRGSVRETVRGQISGELSLPAK